MLLTDVVEPTRHLPTDEELFALSPDGRRLPNIDFLKAHFCREGKLKPSQAIDIIEGATRLLDKEPTLLHVDAPVTGKQARIL